MCILCDIIYISLNLIVFSRVYFRFFGVLLRLSDF